MDARHIYDDRRGITRAVAIPAPFLFTTFGVKCFQRAGVLSTQVGDQQSPVDYGRGSRAIIRRGCLELPGEIFPPEELALRCIVTGENAGDAQSVKLPIVIDRR